MVANDYCGKIAQDNSLSLDDFYFLNPALDTSCTNLQLGVAYCVKAVGEITTYPGYSTTAPSTTFTRPATTSTVYVTVPTETLNPHASGTVEGCDLYQNYFDSSSLVDAYGSPNYTVTTNDCTSVAAENRISLSELLEWNPSLTSDNCQLQAGYSYCVQKNSELRLLLYSSVWIQFNQGLSHNIDSNYHFE